MTNSCKSVPTWPRMPTMSEILKTHFTLSQGASSHLSNHQGGRSPSLAQPWAKHFSNSKIWSSRLNSDSQKGRYLSSNNLTPMWRKSVTWKRSNKSIRRHAGPQSKSRWAMTHQTSCQLNQFHPRNVTLWMLTVFVSQQATMLPKRGRNLCPTNFTSINRSSR